MLGIIHDSQYAGMNSRMESFDTAIKDFWKTGHIRDCFYFDAGVFQRGKCSAGGNNLYTEFSKRLRKFDYSFFVGNTNQRALNRERCVGIR